MRLKDYWVSWKGRLEKIKAGKCLVRFITTDYTTLFLFYKKKTCAKRKTNGFFSKKGFLVRFICVNLR